MYSSNFNVSQGETTHQFGTLKYSLHTFIVCSNNFTAMKFPKKLAQKLQDRQAQNAFRVLNAQSQLVDFSSNDYLGFAQNEQIFHQAHQLLLDKNILQNGATGSRLISGNHQLYTDLEELLKQVHQVESATIFNSGYNANVGLLSCIPQRDDLILYDEYSHASIREGIQLSNAKAYKFQHNNLEDLEEKLKKYRATNQNEIYIITEMLFSMDGDMPDIEQITDLAQQYKAKLILDEAHYFGVALHQNYKQYQTKYANTIFARVVTYGKALGCHGAVVLGTQPLKEFLVNFSRSFIYTTALPPHAIATIYSAYQYYLSIGKNQELVQLNQNIQHFLHQLNTLDLANKFIQSQSAIQCCIIGDNQATKQLSKQFEQEKFNIKAILSPTVSAGKERLRFCIHAYNTTEEITNSLHLLKTFLTA